MGNIKNIPMLERPYEKLKFFGSESLSNSELLSIIISSGTKYKSSIDIAQEIIRANEDNLRFLIDSSIEEISKIEGIGDIKAIQLKAVGEISKRIIKPISNKTKIICSEDAINLVKNELVLENKEVLKIILLNNQNYIIRLKTIAVGSESNIIINIKTILSETIRASAPKIILIHNHPSGNSKPSNFDIEFTKKIKNILNIMDVQLLDHIIISENGFSTI